MKPISHFNFPIKINLKKGGTNSAFSEAVGNAITVMGKEAEEKGFGYWCGRLKKIPAPQIHEWTKKCEGVDSPIKLFQWFVKEYRKKA